MDEFTYILRWFQLDSVAPNIQCTLFTVFTLQKGKPITKSKFAKQNFVWEILLFAFLIHIIHSLSIHCHVNEAKQQLCIHYSEHSIESWNFSRQFCQLFSFIYLNESRNLHVSRMLNLTFCSNFMIQMSDNTHSTRIE